MKYHNTSGGKRKTKKRGGTKSTNAKPQKVVKTLKQQYAQQATQQKQEKLDRRGAITNRIKKYNLDNPEKLIAEKYGARALTSKNNNQYTNEQFTDTNNSYYLTDAKLYNLYEDHKYDTAVQRKGARVKDRENKEKSSSTSSRVKERKNKAKSSSPVASLRQPFIDLDGNPSAYPFSDKKYDRKRESGLLSGNNVMPNSPTTSPQDLFNDLNYIIKTPPKTSPKTSPKTPPIDYSDDYAVIDGMFDTPKKNHPTV